ncbi:MAG: glycosyl transferase family 1 [Acidobacteria bacterium RIFCSPLOWO2_12_FULL_60_22]|nr:MAG: glycosyl transferase family 1 [Acidobacteria bacterium RIFCSPLOWO2_12_FULL_60_22]
MKIAILGTRGIPANYGGFETFAEELSSRLVQHGHSVVVYGRTNNIRYEGTCYKGVRLVLLPTISHKYFDTVAHTFLSACHVLFQDVDVVLICNAANSVFSFLPRLAGKKTVVNVDGLERNRQKWNALGKAYYRLSERLSTFLPNAIVTDAKTIQAYYQDRYGKRSYFIPYGADSSRLESRDCLDRLGLEPEGYFLYVSRLEPENNALLAVQAFERVATDKKLVIVGDAPYARDYIARLRSTSDPRILFPGAIYGAGYRELQSHAFCYIHATEVGGTHPALIEAMGCGRCVLYLDTPENREAAGDAAIAFTKSPEALAEKISAVLADPGLRADCQRRAVERIGKRYRWEDVTAEYERLFRELLGNKAQSQPSDDRARLPSDASAQEGLPNDHQAALKSESLGSAGRRR